MTAPTERLTKEREALSDDELRMLIVDLYALIPHMSDECPKRKLGARIDDAFARSNPQRGESDE